MYSSWFTVLRASVFACERCSQTSVELDFGLGRLIVSPGVSSKVEGAIAPSTFVHPFTEICPSVEEFSWKTLFHK